MLVQLVSENRLVSGLKMIKVQIVMTLKHTFSMPKTLRRTSTSWHTTYVEIPLSWHNPFKSALLGFPADSGNTVLSWANSTGMISRPIKWRHGTKFAWRLFIVHNGVGTLFKNLRPQLHNVWKVRCSHNSMV